MLLFSRHRRFYLNFIFKKTQKPFLRTANNCQKTPHPTAAFPQSSFDQFFPFYVIQMQLLAVELHMWLKDSAALIKTRKQLVFKPL